VPLIHPGPVAGVDEAGRGPLAGPLVVAAVILDPGAPDRGTGRLQGADPGTARELALEIRGRALAYAVIEVGLDEIERATSSTPPCSACAARSRR
jgi:ribonuclease HII